jgi:hypothetical protein
LVSNTWKIAKLLGLRIDLIRLFIAVTIAHSSFLLPSRVLKKHFNIQFKHMCTAKGFSSIYWIKDETVSSIYIEKIISTLACSYSHICISWRRTYLTKEYVRGVRDHTTTSMMVYMLGICPYIEYMDILILYTSTKV